MKISVIIPVYNAEPYLERAVLSVLKQPEIDEILLVNDQSADRSLQLSFQLKEKYPIIKVLKHDYPTNQGAAFCRNLGIVEAKNEWLAFLDSDDYYLDDRFKPFLNVIKEHPEADGVYDAVLNEFESEEAKRDFVLARPQKYKKESLSSNLLLYTLDKAVEPEELFESLIRSENGFLQLNGLTIKKELCVKAGLMARDVGYMEDTHFLLKVACLGNLYPGSLNKPVAVRIVHDSNITTLQKGKAIDYRRKMYLSLYRWVKSEFYCKSKPKLIREMAVKSFMLQDLRTNNRKFFRTKYFLASVIHYFVCRF